ncbi:MAG: glycosyltransferase family 39 protein, partial [Desulfobacteraceae bacterium]|nr:glycosyltransferase family 39 protein [Desulfobacteraceae bacterium]
MNPNKLTSRPNTGSEVRFKAFLVGLLVALIIAIILLCSVPPVSKDALVHHLAVPKLYLRHGGMYEIPFMPFSYFPMNLDLLYLIPLYFGNDIVPKFIHFGFALLTAWLIFNYLKKRINTAYALLGVIFFLSIPIIVKLSITVYVDLGLIFFSTASLLLLLRWIEDGFRLKLLVVSALFCGLAAGTKYNGLITIFLITLFVPFVYSRYSLGAKPSFFSAAGYGMLFLSITLLFFSPWMIRNYVWTHNPLYPLYENLFNPQNVTNGQTIGLFTFRGSVYHETWWEIALLPFRVFFQGQDANPQYFDGKLNPFLIALPFCAFFQMQKDGPVIKNEKKILLAFAGLFFATAFFTSDMRIRYISPIIPPLVLLSVFGVKRMVVVISELRDRDLRNAGLAALFLVLSFCLSLNAYYVYTQYKYVDPFSYLSSTLSRDEYIDKYRFEYPVIRYINENVNPHDRILFLFMGKRGYYCDKEYILDMVSNRSLLRQLVKKSRKPEEILQGLRGNGITHMLIRYDIFDRWVKDEVNFTIREQELLGRFFKR